MRRADEYIGPYGEIGVWETHRGDWAFGEPLKFRGLQDGKVYKMT